MKRQKNTEQVSLSRIGLSKNQMVEFFDIAGSWPVKGASDSVDSIKPFDCLPPGLLPGSQVWRVIIHKDVVFCQWAVKRFNNEIRLADTIANENPTANASRLVATASMASFPHAISLPIERHSH